jgi:phosphoribosylanthranilate isomerase
MPVRIKICGIRSDRDLALAVEAGADAVGFLVGLDYETDDALLPEAAAALSRQVPPFVTRVVVTHRTTVDEVAELAYAIPCDAVQLHGEFPLDRIDLLRLSLPPSVRVHRVVHVTGPEAVPFAAEVSRVADAVHLDTRTEDRVGGTGLVHDWKLSMRIVKWVRKPVVLAGGLTPENVRDAVRGVGPAAVDVNTGVEDAVGDKDALRLRAFVKAARSI